jgi:hypothetical protein
MLPALRVLAVLGFVAATAAAGGGNCENVCNSGLEHFASCLERESCTVADLCTGSDTPDPCVHPPACPPRWLGNVFWLMTRVVHSVCTCTAACQECFGDAYAECGGCSSKTGYDFDADVHPDIKAQAESMGCSGAAQGMPGLLVALAAAAGLFLQ